MTKKPILLLVSLFLAFSLPSAAQKDSTDVKADTKKEAKKKKERTIELVGEPDTDCGFAHSGWSDYENAII